MFERVKGNQNQQRQNNSSSDGFFAPKKPQMAPVESNFGAMPIQMQENKEQETLARPSVTYDVEQLLHSTTHEPRERMPLQMKLTIGEVGDKYEQEADRVASSVVRQMNRPPLESESPMKPVLQRRDGIGGGEASKELEGAINRAKGGGRPLDSGLQGKMGQAMGENFSGVKVHTDVQADSLNRSLQARAFTTGSNIFFKRGEYNPQSRGGQELIAHELTHVVQQNSSTVQRQEEKTQPEIAQSALEIHGQSTLRYGTTVQRNGDDDEYDEEYEEYMRLRGELEVETERWLDIESRKGNFGEGELNDKSIPWMTQRLSGLTLKEAEDVLLHWQETKALTVEVGLIYDDEGNLTLAKTGEPRSIDLDATEYEASGTLPSKRKVTHNHPSGSALTITDITHVWKWAATEIRAVGKYGVSIARLDHEKLGEYSIDWKSSSAMKVAKGGNKAGQKWNNTCPDPRARKRKDADAPYISDTFGKDDFMVKYYNVEEIGANVEGITTENKMDWKQLYTDRYKLYHRDEPEYIPPKP